MEGKQRVYLSLGSNIGNREGYLHEAINHLGLLHGTVIEAVSGIYETKPVGFIEQPMFLNIAVRMTTGFEPLELLGKLHGIETSLGRVRQVIWGPRTIDIDIILFGNKIIDSPDLTIPHARMKERAFVLIPLKDIYEGDKIMGIQISDLIEKCNDKSDVVYFSDF